MKVGSLVVCLKTLPPSFDFIKIDWLPIVGETYTVRDMELTEAGTHCIVLEEGIMCGRADGQEGGLPAAWFREVQPPLSLSALLEECESLTLETV